MLRKIVAFIVAVILFALPIAVADELVFCDIPWGTHPEGVIEKIRSIGYLPTVYGVGWIESLGCNEDLEPSITYASCAKAGYGCSAINISDDLTVAGHKVSRLSIDCIYGIVDGQVSLREEDAEFVAAEYKLESTDRLAVFKDLKTKLTNLYGEPQTTWHQVSEYSFHSAQCDEIYDAVLWTGDNDTAILLELNWYTTDGKTEYTRKNIYGEDIEDTEIYLFYGKLDIHERLEIIEEYLNGETESEIIKQNASNYDGL